MAAAKKQKEQFIKLAPPGLPTTKVTVSLTIKSDDNPQWQINSDLFIVNMNLASSCTQDLIMGDRILRINGKEVKSADQATGALMPGASQVKLIVERRQHAVAVPPGRLKKIGAQRMEGFSYCLITCVNTGKYAKATLGFTLSLLKNKAHIVTVETGSIASQHFAIGDALLDVDGTPIPFADLNFLKNYAHKFFKEGQFTVVVERPTTPQRIEQYTMVYKTMLPQNDSDDEMGADAIKIGMEAASMHNLVFKKIRPRSCLSADSSANTAATCAAATTATVEENDRKVRIASSSVVTVIGSDVDDEDDLRKVERKSHSKEQMNLDDL